MENLMNEQIMYIARVNGVAVTPKLASKFLVESELSKLSADIREQAQIVPITSKGMDLLFEG
jgi:hypothetical protein